MLARDAPHQMEPLYGIAEISEDNIAFLWDEAEKSAQSMTRGNQGREVLRGPRGEHRCTGGEW